MNNLQKEVLKFFGEDYQITKTHEDGDLSILSNGIKYVVTTEGEFFIQIKPEHKEKE